MMSGKEVSYSNTCKCFVVFAMWTFTSFSCHYTGKQFLNSSSTNQNGFLHALILTLYQTFMCYCLTDIKIRNDKFFLSMTICHFLATLATNFSMALMFASSTFAIKMMEPITSACVQRLLLSTPLHPSIFASLPLIVGGACMFTGNPLTDTSISIGTVMAFLSNIILAIRNVTIKLDQNKSVQLSLRPFASLLVVAACHAVMIPLLYFLEMRLVITSAVTYSVVCACLSGVFHVSYSFISTNIVLRYMTVLSHSVTNILKRLLVVLLLYCVGQKHASSYNFLGLFISCIGLLVYVGSKSSFNYKQYLTPKDKVIPEKGNFRPSRYLLAFVCLGIFGFQYQHTNYGSGPEIYSPGFKSRSFGGKSFEIIDNTYMEPNIDQVDFENKELLSRFLQTNLAKTPQTTNFLSPLLKTSTEVIREAQRIHFSIFKGLIGHFRYAMLFDVAAFENKGDPAISSGEVYLLRRLGIDLIYYCSFSFCKTDNLEYAKRMSEKYSKKELVILIHGGGNIVGYALNDILRFRIFHMFEGFKIVVFSQSVFLKNYNGHFQRCKQLYCCNKNLTLVLRDKQSLEIAKQYFNNGTNLVMAPDMAFQIGRVERYMSPMYDILWLKRKDSETPNYQIPQLPEGVSVKVRDWWGWQTPKGDNSLENAFLIATNGMMFLQRGRVVITDRLHGHILCTLLNIPHVLIDNRFKKLSSYHNTWTKSLQNTLITTNATEAVELALTLLNKFKDDIPPIAPFMNIEEHPFEDSRGRPIRKTEHSTASPLIILKTV